MCDGFNKKAKSRLRSPGIAVVVDAYTHALIGCYPRARYLIGWDAKMAVFLSWLPEWMGDQMIICDFFRKTVSPAKCKWFLYCLLYAIFEHLLFQSWGLISFSALIKGMAYTMISLTKWPISYLSLTASCHYFFWPNLWIKIALMNSSFRLLHNWSWYFSSSSH